MQQGSFYPQNQQQPQPQKNRPIISGGTIIKIILKLLLGGRTYNLLIFCRAKAVILSTHGRRGGAEEVFKHINNLLRDATHSFSSAKGFGAFVQLLLIAIVIG